MIRELSKDFEIGGHSKTHPADLKNLEDELMYQELHDNKKWLEYLTGKKLTKFCPPRGRYDDRVIGIIKKAGFKESSGYNEFRVNRIKGLC
jgi:peptidoglycan/xylan/chitin deacetylase (PgdA/CDA1 family)